MTALRNIIVFCNTILPSFLRDLFSSYTRDSNKPRSSSLFSAPPPLLTLRHNRLLPTNRSTPHSRQILRHAPSRLYPYPCTTNEEVSKETVLPKRGSSEDHLLILVLNLLIRNERSNMSATWVGVCRALTQDCIPDTLQK